MSIFDDLAGMPDETEITLGDKTIKLGDLKTEYSAARTERDTIAGERDRYRGEYEKLGSTVAQLLGTADKAATDAVNQPPPADPKQGFMDSLRQLVAGEDPVEALYQDKLFGKALTRAEERAFERAMAENKKTAESLKAMEDMVKTGFQNLASATVYQQDAIWYGDNKADIPKGQDGKRFTLKQLQDYADQNGIYQPGTRIRDMDRVLDIITAPTRRQAEIETAKREAYEAGMQAARANAGKVIPLMSDRSGGGMGTGNKEYSTAGKSTRQIMQERIAQGMSELAEEGG